MISLNRLLQRIAPLMAVPVMAASPMRAAHASDAVCGVGFDAARFGLVVDPIQPDEQSDCGRFLTRAAANLPDRTFVWLVVFSTPAAIAIRSNPSNFVVTGDGSLKFKLPRPVNDARTFYFVRPLRIVAERTIPMRDGMLYVAEYERRVERLKKTGALDEVPVKERQRCVDAARTTHRTTVVMSGCDLASHGRDLAMRTVGLLTAATLPVGPR